MTYTQLGFDLEALFDVPVVLSPDDAGVAAGHRLSAAQIAATLGRPEPTVEQVRVIEAPLDPLLIVAGAGSGKTETMAARVVWLVANGLARPEEVLGLTFTRKAAGELAERVRARLRALHRHGLVAEDPAPVTVSTYHSYAASVLGDHGLRLGVEPTARLLTEAGAWQLAAEVVDRWDGDMSDVEYRPATVTEVVLALAAECAEHLRDPGDVEAFLADLVTRCDELPGRRARVLGDVLAKVTVKRALLPLVEAYLRRKRQVGVLDFGDQVALAARVAAAVPAVGAGERARYPVVLLDEYQDTSHAQLVLLRSLFGGGHPVTAVGDPHQSIYGWRGASAGSLRRFPGDFADADGRAASIACLSTSWRNDVAVLGLANRMCAELPTVADSETPPLAARPGAGPGTVSVAWLSTLEDEAEAVADFVATHRAGGAATAAVLCRARALFPAIEAALRARELPVEVVGLGGLLAVPEVADVRAALEAVHDPSRGDSLMRLLIGPAVCLGPRDLEALGSWSMHLLGRTAAVSGAAADTVDERSIVEAVDDLPPPGWRDSAGRELSEAGRARLARLAGLLRQLRERSTSLPLPDLVAETERALLLDVEVAARPGVPPAAARASLDAFLDVAASFSGESAGASAGGSNGRDAPGVGAFLAWLAAADARERGLETPVVQPHPEAVQVLTVHAAKGLEWDVVAVPGLVEGTFPAGHAGRAPGPGGGWAAEAGALPYPLRGDAAELPDWAFDDARSQDDLLDSLERYREACGEHTVAEERRLAYVAFTRARSSLLLTGAIWGDGAKPRQPSRFLEEAADTVGTAQWAPTPADRAINPREAARRVGQWPFDPLGERRADIEAGAARVRAAMARKAAGSAADATAAGDQPWAREVALLLAERDAAAHMAATVELPAHLSASRVVDLATDPVALAESLRRPMPAPPSASLRRGSAFHAWLEQRYGATALVEVDDLPGAADEVPDDVELAALQARFLASEWADKVPEAVEVAVETPVGGVSVRGRIDAVFGVGHATDGSARRWDVVDWKTGPPPRDEAAARGRAVQLAVYRLAWARLNAVAVEAVGAAFFYAATGETVRPVDLLDADALAELIASAVTG